MPDRTLVIAGNYQQFLDWCHRTGNHPCGPKARYVSAEEQLCGVPGKGTTVILTGQPHLNKAYLTDRYQVLIHEGAEEVWG